MDPNLSPSAWLDFLNPKLDEQAKTVQVYDNYYNGEHQLTFATAKFQEAFARFFPTFANNFMQLVVDTPVSRLHIQGFRFATPDDGLDVDGDERDPTTGALKDAPWELEADDDAWEAWQSNNMDSISRMVHTDAVKLGCAYVSIHAPQDGDEFPTLCPEHPSQVIVQCDPERPTERLAALKRYIDEFDMTVHADIYLPEAKYRFVGDKPSKDGSTIPKGMQWILQSEEPIEGGVVPVVPIYNRPSLLGGGQSDLDNAIPLQDAINKLCLDMMVTSEFHAFPQRWAVGWTRAVDDAGREISNREEEIYFSQSRIIRAEAENVKFGEFQQANMQNYLGPIEMFLDHLAVQTQTPVYYLKGKSGTVSADAMHSMDQGLVDRCRAKINSFSDGWEEVLRCVFLQLGDKQKGTAQTVEVVWDDVESRSMAVQVQAAQIMRTSLSVPIEIIWGDMLGWSPAKIRLARDLMNLPPGGPAMSNPTGMAPPGAPGGPAFQENPDANSPETHPGNQPGLPSGQAYQGSPSEQ